MDHSIKVHTRLSHFLVTVEETVNLDVQLDEQIPLGEIWQEQHIRPQYVLGLQLKLEHAREDGEKGWELAFEDETCIASHDYGDFPRIHEMPKYQAGIFFPRDGSIVIVGKFYNGSESGEAPNGNYTWFFKKVK